MKKAFFIGAATAAHQVEGNNTNSDYWAQEQLPHSSFTEPSGIACDHYHRYEEDIKLLADAGLNAYRFSIEWARVEPEEGTFDPEAIEHYRKVIACCKAHGVEPVVTLLHFTSPKWLICKGGWEAESTVEDFKNYAIYVMEQLGSELRYVCTINEANMGLQLAAISKRFRLMAEQAAKKCRRSRKVCRGHSAGGHELPEDDGKHEVCCHGERAGVRHTPAADLCQRAHPRRAICWCCAPMQPHGMPSRPSARKSRWA